MGNKQSSEVKTKTRTFTFNGVTKEYPVKNYDSYEKLPQEFKEKLIKFIKEEIKSDYEKYGNEFGIFFLNKVPNDFFIVNDTYTYCTFSMIKILNGIFPELKTYCNTLFGPNVPYSIDYDLSCGCYKITFIHNI